ncbi:MAG TPA: LLM class flavin-dependent oxidoreductase [Acidimicrobiales bacterium]|nr:LLM class flavin-dependent oxidoreductase [Acidimicrobiales bacterium]
MRIGISIGSTYTDPDHRYGPGVMVEQAQAAHRAGLDSLTVGDHHSTGPAAYAQNVPVIGRILADWTDRQSGCLFLVPLWHPVLMAEQIGTLAAMASGPFIVQAALGAGSAQFRAMGRETRDRVTRFEEGLRVVRALFAGETVSSDLFGVHEARVAPLPPEGVEWWMGADAAIAVHRAARLGDCWYGNADLTPDRARQKLAEYREACGRYGREPVRLPIRKDVFIAEDRVAAERHGDELMAAGYRGFVREAVAYGDPASVAEQLSVYSEIGFTDVIVRVMTASPADTVRSVELAGEVQRLLA